MGSLDEPEESRNAGSELEHRQLRARAKTDRQDGHPDATGHIKPKTRGLIPTNHEAATTVFVSSKLTTRKLNFDQGLKPVF